MTEMNLRVRYSTRGSISTSNATRSKSHEPTKSFKMPRWATKSKRRTTMQQQHQYHHLPKDAIKRHNNSSNNKKNIIGTVSFDPNISKTFESCSNFDDEENLRLNAYHRCSQIIDECIEDTFRESIGTHDIIGFLNRSVPSRCVVPNMKTAACYDFPMGIVHSSYSLLDMSQILSEIKRQIAMSSSAICHISGRSNDKKEKDAVKLMVDVFHQCLLSDDNPSSYFLKMKFRSTSLVKRKIWEWASRTEKFDSIVILLQDSEMLPIAVLDDFVATLSHLRAIGVPISLLIFASPLVHRRLSEISRSSMNSVVVEEFGVTDSVQIFDLFIKKIFLSRDGKECLPVLISGEILERVREYFMEYHLSVTKAAKHIKMALAHHFSKKGSFLVAIYDPVFTKNNVLDLQKFCIITEKRKSIVSPTMSREDLINQIDNSMQRRVSLPLAISLTNITIDKLSIAVKLPLEAFLLPSSLFLKTVEKACDKMKTMELSELLQMIADWRKEAIHHTRKALELQSYDKGDFFRFLADATSKATDSIISQLNGFIVMIDALTEDKAHHDEFRNYVSNWFLHYIHQSSAKWTLTVLDAVSPHTIVVKQPPFLSRPRFVVHTALINPQKFIHCQCCLYDDACSTMHDAVILYKLFKNVAIPIEKWFNDFQDVVEASDGVRERFAAAVYELMICGLINWKKGKVGIIKREVSVWIG